MYKFSKITNLFYPVSSLDYYKDLPDDLIDVDAELGQKAIDHRANGGTFDVKNDQLVIVPIPDSVFAQREKDVKIAELKSQIQTLEFKCLRPLREGDTKRVADIDTQIKVLRDEIKSLEISK